MTRRKITQPEEPVIPKTITKKDFINSVIKRKQFDIKKTKSRYWSGDTRWIFSLLFSSELTTFFTLGFKCTGNIISMSKSLAILNIALQIFSKPLP